MTKHIVVIGGGTGTSSLAFYLKEYPPEEVRLTAIVAVSDDGGSSKKIRSNYEVIALGDLGHVIESLIPTAEKDLRLIIRNRIQSDNGKGFADGHTVVNFALLIALKTFNGDIVRAIKAVMRMFRAQHTVLPVTANNVHLEAWFDDFHTMIGEGAIDNRLKNNPEDKRKIVAVYLKPDATILPEAEQAIDTADTIVVCAGSQFTSVGACLCVAGVSQAIRKNTKAKFIQVINLMDNANESPGWKASHHAANVFQAALRPLDYVICNDVRLVSPEVRLAYSKENARPVEVDECCLSKYANKIIVGDYADEQKIPIRHNAKLAELIVSL